MTCMRLLKQRRQQIPTVLSRPLIRMMTTKRRKSGAAQVRNLLVRMTMVPIMTKLATRSWTLTRTRMKTKVLTRKVPLLSIAHPVNIFLLTVSLKFTALAGFAGSEGSDSDVPVLAIVGGGLILATIIGIAGFILYKKAGASNATAAAAASGKGAAAGTAVATTKAAAAGAAGGLEVAAANAGGASASSVAQTGSTASYKSAIGAASKAGSKSAAGAASNSAYHGGRAIPFKHRAPVKSFAKTALTSLTETTDKSVYKVLTFTTLLIFKHICAMYAL